MIKLPDLGALQLDKKFREVATWFYAINQSRAKVVLDPVYLGVSTTLLRGSSPSRELLAKQYPKYNEMFLPYRQKARKLQYFVEDWDFSQVRPDLLTPRQRQMMHTVALGETSGAAVGDGFLRAFRTIPDLAAFFGTWFVEELNHFLGFHFYIERMGEKWEEERGLKVAKVDFIPYAENPYEVAAANMYQELIGFLIYRSFGKQVRDPFLAKMLGQFAKDELRHYKYYQDVVARHIQQNPDFRRVVLKTVLKATSPFNQVSGSFGAVIDNLRKGAYWFRKAEYDFFIEQMDFLLGADLREFFGWFFKGLLPPCEQCRQELYQCGCEVFEGEAAKIEVPQLSPHAIPLHLKGEMMGAAPHPARA